MANRRLLRDLETGTVSLKEELDIHIAADPKEIRRVHFVLPGAEDSPFEGGLYHGMLFMNERHPFGPPSIYMFTPSGRFEASRYPINSNDRGICTTQSAFHPETWRPIMSIYTVLVGFASYMTDLEEQWTGILENVSKREMKELAIASHENLKRDEMFKRLFPELSQEVIEGTYVPHKVTK